MNRCVLILQAFLWMMVVCSSAHASYLIADISAQTLIKGVDFNGREISISGITDNNTQLLAVIKGPYKNYKISQKQKQYGVWIDNDKYNFRDVPSYFFLAASSNILENLDAKVMKEVGVIKETDLVPYVPLSIDKNEHLFYSKLVALKKSMKMYLLEGNGIERVGNNIFRVRAFLPINANLGDYEVNIYKLEGGLITNEVKLHFNLDNIGFDQAINELAHTKPLRHGLLAVVIALFSGALVGFLFRKHA